MIYAYKKSVDFESATVDLQKVIDKEPEKLGAAQKAAMELSSQYGESSSKILQSTANFVQAGFTVDESMKLTKNALNLVIAGDIEASQASELLVAALKGFKAPASDAARLIDVLNEVSNKYATNTEQLARGMAGIAPIAKIMGFSFEETAGILTPVIEVFRSGDEAAIALKTGLLKLLDDSEPVKKALAQIGVSQRDSNGHLRSGRDILMDVAKAFQTVDENQKLFLTKEIVGIEQSARMVEVFNNLSKSAEITSVAMNAAGSATQEVQIRLASSESVLKRFATGFENLGVIVGDQFRISVTKAVSGGLDIENSLQKIISDQTFKPIFDAFNSFSDKLGTFLSGVAEAMPEAFKKVNFNSLINAFEGLGDEIKSFFGDLDLTKPEDLTKAIQGAVDAIAVLINITSGIIDQFKPVWDFIKEGISRMSEMDEASQKHFGNFLGAAKQVVDAGIYIAGAIIAIKETGVEVGRVFDVVIGSIKVLWNTFEIGFDNIAYAVVKTLEKINSGLSAITWGDRSDYFKQKAEEFKQFADAINENRLENIKDRLDGFNQAMGNAADKTKETSQAIRDIPDKKDISILINENQKIAELIDWSKNEDIKKIMVQPDLSNLTSMDLFKNQFEGAIPGVIDIKIDPTIDGSALENTKKALDAISSKKYYEIQAIIDPDSKETCLKFTDDILRPRGIKISPKIDEVDDEKVREKLSKLKEQETNVILKIDEDSHVKTQRKIEDLKVKERELQLELKLHPEKAAAIKLKLAELEHQETKVTTRIDQDAFNKTHNALSKFDKKEALLQASLDNDSVRKTRKALDDSGLKELDIRAKIEMKNIDLDIAKVKAQADSFQKVIEWKAKLDIAEVEANAKILEAAFGSINKSIESTGSLIGDLFKSWENDSSFQKKWAIEDQIKEENDRRQQSFELQKKLTEAEIELIKQKADKSTASEFGWIGIDDVFRMES